MNFKIFSAKKEFDIKSLSPNRFNVLKYWVWSLFVLLLIIIGGAAVSSRIFLTIYMEDYKLETEEIAVDKINVTELKSIINSRQEFINQEVTLPKDPSI